MNKHNWQINFFTRFLPVLIIGTVLIGLILAITNGVEPLRGDPVKISVVEDTGGTFTPAMAYESLRKIEPKFTASTALSRNYFWLLIPAMDQTHSEQQIIDIPSRHSVSISCWKTSDFSAIGSGNRSTTSGAIHASKAGFSIDPAPRDSVICQSEFRGPAKITANRWGKESINLAHTDHQKTSSMIESGLGVLTIFLLMTAFINKDPLYLIFACTIVLNMRMAALTAGTDFEFFGYQIPIDQLYDMRKWTVAGYFAITAALFGSLFKNEIVKTKISRPMNAQYILSAVLLLTALVSDFETTLVMAWAFTFVGIFIVIYCLGKIIRKGRSRIAVWYAMSIVTTLFASLNEIATAATSYKFTSNGFNSVTAAFASALLASIAMAEHMRREKQEKVRAKDALKATYEGSPIGLFTVRNGSEIVKFNKPFSDISGVRQSDGISISTRDYFQDDTVNILYGIASKKSQNFFEHKANTKFAGTNRWFSIKSSTQSGEIIECSIIEITDQVNATQKLEFLASHDPLTECLNLRGISNCFPDGVLPKSLAYLDLDRFKIINDLYGHDSGDNVLKQVSARIYASLGPHDVLARVGGDEFVVAFPTLESTQATAVCKRIIESIESTPFPIESQSFALSVSIGLVGTIDSYFAEIVSSADTLCRMAKKKTERLMIKGVNDTFFKTHKDELELISCLEKGDTPDGLFLVMQPEISLSKPFDSLNFEILLRMRKADGSILPANIIIETAESHRKTAIIDRWVLNTAIEWIETNSQKLTKTQFIGVNLSGGSLNDESFLEYTFDLFNKHPQATSIICLEITETVALTDMKKTQVFIDKMRSIGVKVALDDFGAGYSSFMYLKGLSVDALKIDGSLVKDAAKNPASMAIITAIAGLVSNLGMKSIGEFAEDESTIRALSMAGVDYAQGYGISKPVMPEQILKASSSADFIDDPKTLEFVKKLQDMHWRDLPRRRSDDFFELHLH